MHKLFYEERCSLENSVSNTGLRYELTAATRAAWPAFEDDRLVYWGILLTAEDHVLDSEAGTVENRDAWSLTQLSGDVPKGVDKFRESRFLTNDDHELLFRVGRISSSDSF